MLQLGAWTLVFVPLLNLWPLTPRPPNIKLDGMDFQLASLPRGGFCPILQPVNKDVFTNILVGHQVQMYTFMEDGCPVHLDEAVKGVCKLTLTDRYFGNEYLVPWTISNGVAVAS